MKGLDPNDPNDMAIKLVTILCILLCQKNSTFFLFCVNSTTFPPQCSLSIHYPAPRHSRPLLKVAVYWVPVIEAIRVTGATCKAAGLYQRVSCHRAQEVVAEELAIAEYNRKNDPDNNNMATALKTPLAVLLRPPLTRSLDSVIMTPPVSP